MLPLLVEVAAGIHAAEGGDLTYEFACLTRPGSAITMDERCGWSVIGDTQSRRSVGCFRFLCAEVAKSLSCRHRFAF